jgi:FRG domain
MAESAELPDPESLNDVPEASESNLTPEQQEAFGHFLEHQRTLGDRPFGDFFREIHFSSSTNLLEFFMNALTSEEWAFRGHSEVTWRLQPTAERHGTALGAGGIDQYVVRALKRRAHQYLNDLPQPDDTLEWLALAQHYGAPTTLLDFSHSPYVATFFAVTEQLDAPSAVWALDVGTLKHEALQHFRSIDSVFSTPNFQFGSAGVFDELGRHLWDGNRIVPVQPLRMNERLTVQQGLFLYPVSIFGFESALKNTIDSWCRRISRPDACNNYVYKLVVEPQARLEILKELNRMNVTYASLFPGIDGFARSLRTNVRIRDKETLGLLGPQYDEPI